MLLSRTKSYALPIVVGILISTPCVLTAGTLTPIDFSSVQNIRIQTAENPSFPEGNVVLGGIPFNIPVGGNNEWTSGNGGGEFDSSKGIFTLTIPVNIAGVDSVYTLINSSWGVPTGGRILIEFFGSGGAYYSRDLVGNSDVRDWNALIPPSRPQSTARRR